MKNKFINVVLVLAILSILSIVSVSAATTITVISPADGGTIASAIYKFNSTITGYGWVPAGTLLNITYYAKSSLTANSSWSLIGTNNTVNLTTLGKNATVTTLSTVGLEDANNYVINVTYKNATGGNILGEDTSTSVIVDNTKPTAPSALTPTSDTDGTVDFSSTVVGRETTSCILYFTGSNPGLSSYAMVHTIGTNTCTYSSLSMPEQTYNWYVTASDETNTTNSATQTTNVDVYGGSAAKIPALLQEPGVQSTGGATLSVTGETITDKIKSNIGIIAVILVVIFVVVIWIKRK